MHILTGTWSYTQHDLYSCVSWIINYSLSSRPLELQLVDWQHTDCHVTNLVGCITYDKRLIHMIQQTQLQCYEPHWVYNLSQTSHLYDRAANCRVTNRVECITYDMWLIYTIQQIQVQRHEPRWVYEISDMTHSYDTADQLPRHEPRWVYSKRRIHAVVQTNGRVTNRAECRKYQIWLIHPIRQTNCRVTNRAECTTYQLSTWQMAYSYRSADQLPHHEPQ